MGTLPRLSTVCGAGTLGKVDCSRNSQSLAWWDRASFWGYTLVQEGNLLGEGTRMQSYPRIWYHLLLLSKHLRLIPTLPSSSWHDGGSEESSPGMSFLHGFLHWAAYFGH